MTVGYGWGGPQLPHHRHVGSLPCRSVRHGWPTGFLEFCVECSISRYSLEREQDGEVVVFFFGEKGRSSIIQKQDF